MSLDTIFEGTSIGVAASTAFPAMVPEVPGVAPAAGTMPAPDPRSEASTEGRFEAEAGAWVECQECSGVVRIHDPRLFRPGHEAFCRALAESAVESFQARRVEICLTSATCRLEFGPGEFDRAGLARRVAAAVTAATPAIRHQAEATRDHPASWTTLTALATAAGTSIRQGPDDRPGRADFWNSPAPAIQPPGAPKDAPRVVDLALAGGSLTMAVAGVILPGIPSVPFLLLTARHAVRLSPRVDRFLRCRRWSAALLSQAEAPGSLLRPDRRSLLKMLAITVVAAAVFLVIHPPLPVVMGLEMVVMAFACFPALGELGGKEFGLGVLV
jgi:uncharacterized membrane protein YbaN (DUF454 family)